MRGSRALRALTVVALGGLLLGLAAAPASAAKGTPKYTSIQGTLSGTQSTSQVCGWQWQQNFGTGQFEWMGYNATTIDGSGALKATTLGSGTLTWSADMSPSSMTQPTWKFTASNDKSTLSGQLNVNMGFDQMRGVQTENLNFNVQAGTGKFAGVSGQYFNTVQQIVLPNCNPGNQPSFEGSPGQIVPTGSSDEVVPVSTTVIGFLSY